MAQHIIVYAAGTAKPRLVQYKMSLNDAGRAKLGLLIRMQENENPSLQQIRAFLESSQEVHFQAEGRADIYKRYATPWEVFSKLSKAAKCLRRGQTVAALKAEALRCSDTEAAGRMQQAKHELFRRFYPESPCLTEGRQGPWK